MKADSRDRNITELFKQFCKERHTEDKGKNFDLLQEIYSKTELFDLSFVDRDIPELDNYLNTLTVEQELEKETIRTNISFLKDLSLPFECQFVKVGCVSQIEKGSETDGFPNSCIILREYSPTVITGAIRIEEPNYIINTPITIYAETGEILLETKGIRNFVSYQVRFRRMHVLESREYIKALISSAFYILDIAVTHLTNLPKHSVATDTPKRAEYYTRKHGSTIKVVKPIYYVLDKKEEKNPVSFKRIRPLGNCCFDHSFHVIGHWRRINPKTYGKNRNGEYIVTGMTWVKEHTRGEGDLIKKIRVVK